MSTNAESIKARLLSKKKLIESIPTLIARQETLIQRYEIALSSRKDLEFAKKIAGFREKMKELREQYKIISENYSSNIVSIEKQAPLPTETESQLTSATEKFIENASIFSKDFANFQRELREQGVTLAIAQKSTTNVERKLTADKPQRSEPEWATREIVDKVKARLVELGKQSDAEELEKIFVEYTQSSSDQERDKFRRILSPIIHMPGWGHKEPDKRDKLKYISLDEYLEREDRVWQRLAEQNLSGTDEVTKPIIQAYLNLWLSMVDDDQAGQPIPDASNLTLPVFCLDGPPGVGKTTIVTAISYALELNFLYERTQGASSERIVGYGRNWVNPEPALITRAKTSGSSSSVILLDELDKADPKTQDAVGGITEKSERTVKDEYLGVNVEKGFNLIIATTNNFGLLPEHVQSRMTKIYTPGYTDDQKEAILKNKLVDKLKSGHKKVQFLSTGKKDPKTYKEERMLNGKKNITRKPSNCFVAADTGEDPTDAIRYLVENYITEAGVREADALLDQIISEAGKEYAKRVREVRRTSSKDIATATRVDKNFIHKVLGEPDLSIKLIKDLNKKIAEKHPKFEKTSEKLSELVEQVEKQGKEKKGLAEDLESFIKEKDEIITLENQVIEALTKRLQKRLDLAVKKGVIAQLEEHRSLLKNINEKSEKLIQNAQALLGPVSSSTKPSTLVNISNPTPSTQTSPNTASPASLQSAQAQTPTTTASSSPVPSSTLTFSSSSSPPQHQVSLSRSQKRRKSRDSSTSGSSPSTGQAVPTIRTSSGSLFFKYGVAEEIEQHPHVALRIDSPKTVTPEIFQAIIQDLGGQIGSRSTRGNTETPSGYQESEDLESFRGFSVHPEGGSTPSGPPAASPASASISRDGDEVLNISHHGRTIEITASKENPEDDEMYAMVLAAKIAAEKCGRKRFIIEHCEDNPETAFKLYLIGKSMGLTPTFKDAAGQKGATLNGILKGEYGQAKLLAGNQEKPIAEIYEEIEKGTVSADRLKQYIAQLEHPEDRATPKQY